MISPKVGQIFWGAICEINKRMPTNSVVRQIFNFNVNLRVINYLDVNRDGDAVKLSYFPMNRMAEAATEAAIFYSRLRQEGKVGAIIKKWLTIPFTEDELREFVEAFTAEIIKEKFTIVEADGAAIPWYFAERNYIEDENQSSELSKSCMRHVRCEGFFGIYQNNPNCSVVAAMENGKVAARALVWKNVKFGLRVNETKAVAEVCGKDAVTVLDRIYSASPQAKAVVWKWGMANADLLHLKPKNAKKFLAVNDFKIYDEVRLRQPLEQYKYKFYPWIDTFKYYNITKLELCNYMPASSAHHPSIIGFHTTDGSFERKTATSPYNGDF